MVSLALMPTHSDLHCAGFIKFLGPYYMLVITRRREIGAICGHTVYAISKTEMIPLPNSAVRSTIANSSDESRSFIYLE